MGSGKNKMKQLILMRTATVISFCFALSSCAPLAPDERARRDASDQANVHCSGFAHASRTVVGTSQDIVAITKAVKDRTHQEFVGEIRWVSRDRVLVALDHGCCEVTRTKSGSWVVTGFPVVISMI
jgi:hypothetical protein